jgi:hypothetical protein
VQVSTHFRSGTVDSLTARQYGNPHKQRRLHPFDLGAAEVQTAAAGIAPSHVRLQAQHDLVAVDSVNVKVDGNAGDSLLQPASPAAAGSTLEVRRAERSDPQATDVGEVIVGPRVRVVRRPSENSGPVVRVVLCLHRFLLWQLQVGYLPFGRRRHGC